MKPASREEIAPPARATYMTFVFGAGILLSQGAVASPGQYPSEFTSREEATGYLPRDLPIEPVKNRRFEPGGQRLRPVVQRVMRIDDSGAAHFASGALSGKSVYLSPGHGWTYTSSNAWGTQRGNTNGLVEDLSNGDGIDFFLVPYLLNAGAHIVPVREIDPTNQMVILDNSDGAGSPARGKYVESGTSAVFKASTLAGWGHPALPMTGGVNPFTLGGNRLMAAAPKETARAAFILNVPAAGRYNVHISYSMYSARSSDARVTVAHPGGETMFQVDQRQHGGTWVLLGRFYFDKGQNEKTGAVIFSNQSQDAGSHVSVDAVRLGGGMGLMNRGGGTSGFPRADECSRYHAQFAGAPSTVYNPSSGDDRTDDVSTRSRFADWVHAPGEPAVYLSHHTNAFKGTARGTISFVYGTNPVDGTYKPTAKTLALGSDKLAQAIHTSMINDIHAAWDPKWQDRKVKSAYFGELNTSNQDEMAAALIEVAFHDNKEDAAALKEAAFRQIVARAIYKGIVRYFAAREGTPVHLSPAPPAAASARNAGAGTIVVSWSPSKSGGVLGDPATSYRVYRSAGGRAFDNGTDSGGKTSLTLSGLKPGAVVYLRVAATNSGGVSLPGPTLAVRVGHGEKTPLLLVTAFDRIDAGMNLRITYPKVSTVDRLFVDRMNDGTYLVEHGAALSGSQVSFDSCSHEAVDSGAVEPGSYQLVMWQGGKGLRGQTALSAAAQTALTKAASGGTAIFVSGAEIARRLGGASASAADRSFLSSVLHAGFVSADTEYAEVSAAPAGALAGISSWDLSTWKTGPYSAQTPDVIAPQGGGVSAVYGSSGKAAAVQFRGGGRCAMLLSFPLETVIPASARAQIVSRALKFCEVKTPPAPDGGAGADGAAATEAGPPLHTDGAGPTGDGGCGCAAAGGEAGWPALLVCLLAALRGLKRRRR